MAILPDAQFPALIRDHILIVEVIGAYAERNESYRGIDMRARAGL
jgi:hypothetical protein